jgi:hypothetical protein
MDWTQIESIATSIGTIIAAVVICFITFKKQMDNYFIKKKENISHEIVKQSDIDTQILNKLEQVKELIDADRILVYDFHNGEHYANGRSALRMSASFEVTRYGTPRVQAIQQRIPLTMLPNLVNILLDKGELIVDNIENYRELQPEYSICSRLNMKSFYNFIIKNENGDPVGFISFHFKNKQSNVDMESIKKMIWFVEDKIKELA